MNVSRILNRYGFIFPRNVDPLYLQSLVDIGSYPIIIKIVNNKRYVSIFNNSKVIFCDPFTYDICLVSDIKAIFSMIEDLFNGKYKCRWSKINIIEPFSDSARQIILDFFNHMIINVDK